MRTFTLNAVALAMLAMFGTAHAQNAQSELDKVTVTGEGDKLGTGLMVDEDAAKSRSSVTKAQLDKTRSSGNPFQAVELLPGINATSYDATGLFGGNLRVRGFNADQMGLTINGAPVNDSGNFTVFPQEYVDQENICSLYVTQGAADNDAPHVGASGGNLGIQTCAPEDNQRTRLAFSAGQLGFYRLFGRVDTGKIGGFKAFASISKTEADKFRGYGEANRDHLDTGAEYDFGGGNKVSGSFLYNQAVNNNFLALPQYYTPGGALTANSPTFANRGYYADYTNVIPQQAPAINGQAGKVTLPNPAYYGYSLNPFVDALLTVRGTFALSDRVRVDVIPYFWYGYGTGGTEQKALQESSGSTYLHGGVADINHDGDTMDSVLVYSGSVTKTERPGITTTFTYVADNQKISGGFWFEKARHRQTQPATSVDDSGNIGDLWLGSNLLYYNDGTPYQGRNWLTVSTGSSLFASDVIDLMDSRLQITPALSVRRLQRDFTNYAASGTGNSMNYAVTQAYTRPLPSLALSFQATPQVQVFSSATETFRVPNNTELGALGAGTLTVVNGVGTYSGGLANLGVKPEASTNYDLGTRYKGQAFSASATLFLNKFRDRIASSYDPDSALTTDTNVGASTTKGLELELGTAPYRGFSGYVSATYTKSTIDTNSVNRLVNSTTGVTCLNPGAGCVLSTYHTAGAQFPDTPKGMLGTSVQWSEGPYLVNVAAKYTGKRYLTLVDDQSVAGYTTVDLNAAWKVPLPTSMGFKNPIIRLNTSNIFSRKYFIANTGSGSNITPDSTGNPVVYTGAPRFTSMTFQADF